MKPTRACETCRHSTLDASNLYCRRYPPVAQLITVPRQILQGTEINLQNMASFPPVQPAQWCGEWAPEFGALNS
jgi:hypothetical protein